MPVAEPGVSLSEGRALPLRPLAIEVLCALETNHTGRTSLCRGRPRTV